MRHWNNRKYGGSELRFPHAKEFLPKSSTIWAVALKIFRQPCARSKSLHNTGFKGRQIINLPEAPMSGLACREGIISLIGKGKFTCAGVL
jgi:hypothetical protein